MSARRIAAVLPAPMLLSVSVSVEEPLPMHWTVIVITRPGPDSSVPLRSTESTRKEPSVSGMGSKLSKGFGEPAVNCSAAAELRPLTRRTVGL